MKQRIRSLDATITNAKNQRDKKREAMNIFMASLPGNDKGIKEEAEKIKQEVMDYHVKSEGLTQEVRNQQLPNALP
jgi:predicted  nucleic acid-binding Zn-ribbon protein